MLATSGLELFPPSMLVSAWFSKLSSRPILPPSHKQTWRGKRRQEPFPQLANQRAPLPWRSNLFLLGDNLVFNLVVSGLGNDFLSYEVSLLCIWTAVDDFLRIRGADARKGVKLFFGGRVDVEQVSIGSCCSVSAGWFRGLGLSHCRPTDQAQSEQRDKNSTNQVPAHCLFSLLDQSFCDSLYPAALASASVMNLPLLVFPYQRPPLWYTPLSRLTHTLPLDCAAAISGEEG